LYSGNVHGGIGGKLDLARSVNLKSLGFQRWEPGGTGLFGVIAGEHAARALARHTAADHTLRWTGCFGRPGVERARGDGAPAPGVKLRTRLAEWAQRSLAPRV
jgi:hypothetical protein